MLRVPADPFEIFLGAHPTFVLDAKVPHVEGVFVVGQVGPHATSGWLVKVPVRSFNGLHAEFDAGATVPHVDMKDWKR